MGSLRTLVMLAALAAPLGFASQAEAQGGYYRGYRSYWYPPYNNTYHGYWRDQGYGFTPRPYYGTYYYEGYWHSPYYRGYAPYPRGYYW